MGDLEALIGITKIKVGELITKPKMTDKLLSKPPFRFLHDTITAITTTTGFGEGLYSEGELDSAAITEKQAKLNYLDKIFRLVGICKGAPLDVKSSKVVSGLEPEFTNSFLIALAECAADPKFDNAAAVRRCLNGENPGDNPPPIKASSSSAPPPIAESKSEPPVVSSSKAAPHIESESKSSSSSSSSAKAVAESKLPEMSEAAAPAPAERGKSRSGTRGGKPNQASTDIGISGISGVVAPNLDPEIEKCDGSEVMTQTLLGALITRPKLTEKLLAKPPFRFLHDIVMEVIKVTGFATGLYTPSEMDSANVADKAQKIAFLEKIIKVVGAQLNTLVEAKPARIVAGLDAQNTNNWLQLLAVAAKHLPDSTRVVRSVLDQLGSGSSEPAPQPAAPAVSAPEPEPPVVSRAAAKQEKESDEPPPRRSSSSSQQQQQQQQQQPAPVQQFAEAKEPVYAPPMSAQTSRVNDDRRESTTLTTGAAAAEEKMQDDSNIGGGGADDSEAKRSSRPTTARRRPPKVKDGAQEVQAKDIAPATKKAEGIIIDGAGDEIDEEDDIKPSDDLRLADELKADFKSTGVLGSDRNDPQSKLVKDIMSRQAEQEAAVRASNAAAAALAEESKAAGDSASAGAAAKGIRLGQLRKTGVDKKGGLGGTGVGGGGGEHDIEKLRGSIQLLVQNTGPLGTCMDYIQEDISLMTAELHRWEEECRKYEADYSEARARTKELLQPLRTELNDIEDEIAQVIAKIATAKASTARKDNEIQQILRLVASA